MKQKNPLYRKVNTKTRNVWHNYGSDAKYDRNTKKGLNKTMKQGVHRGLDYTPLYRFLHSKVGQDFDVVYSEALKRLPSKDPIFYLVKNDNTGVGYITSGENSYYSSMYVDDNNLLQFVNPNLKNEDFSPTCTCCTHTFNGKPLIIKTYFAPPKQLKLSGSI